VEDSPVARGNAQTAASGKPGFAEALLENANEIAASHKVTRGIEALEAAIRYFPTLRTAA
jgi:hypothetical protein